MVVDELDGDAGVVGVVGEVGDVGVAGIVGIVGRVGVVVTDPVELALGAVDAVPGVTGPVGRLGASDADADGAGRGAVVAEGADVLVTTAGVGSALATAMLFPTSGAASASVNRLDPATADFMVPPSDGNAPVGVALLIRRSDRTIGFRERRQLSWAS